MKNKKKWIIIAVAALLVASLTAVLLWVFLSQNDEVPPSQPPAVQNTSTSFSLGYKAILLQVGQSINLQAKGDSLAFSTDDASIAKIDQSGNVTGVKVGETIVSCKSGKETLTCTVFVCRKGAPVESFSEVTGDSLTLAGANSGGYCGEYAAVTLYLCNNSGISGFSFTLNYDSEALTLKVVDGIGAGVDFVDYKESEAGKVTIAGLSHETNAITDTSGSGAVVRLFFAIKENAPAGTSALALSLADSDMLVAVKDGAEVIVTPSVKNGSIEIKK